MHLYMHQDTQRTAMFDVRARIQMYPIRTSNKALEPSPAGLPTGERLLSEVSFRVHASPPDCTQAVPSCRRNGS
jgi:hypothetical protein